MKNRSIFNITYLEFEIEMKSGRKIKRDFKGNNIIVLTISAINELLYDLYKAKSVKCVHIKRER